MRIVLPSAAVAVIFLLAGCGAVNPGIEKLDSFKTLAAQGRYDEIAARPVSCRAEEKGCDQLQAIRGDACLHQARLAPAEDKADLYACAASSYGAALETPARERGDGFTADAALRPKQLEALRGVRDRATSFAQAVPANDRLADEASSFGRDFAGNPAALLYLADARLFQSLVPSANRGTSCAALAEAGRLIEQGMAAPGDFAANFVQLRRDLANARGGNKDCTQ
jgi:hypothetical protein